MKNQKFKNFITLVLEPFAFGLLALLFIIPSITVINLEPITKKIQELDVLGISSKSELRINVIGGTHQIFRKESIEEVDNTYSYTTVLTQREADRYSKPIIEIINQKQENVYLEIYGNTNIPTNSDITMIINDQVYRLQSPRGDILTHNITLPPGQKYIIFLAIENFSNVQFDEDFELKIKEITY